MSATTFAIENALRIEFQGESSASLIANSNWYLGLSLSAIADDGSGLSEVTGAGYARQPLARNGTDWSLVKGSGYVSNAKEVSFTATDSWGTIVEVFLADSSSGGSIWYHDVLTPSVPILSSTCLIFQQGTITATRLPA